MSIHISATGIKSFLTCQQQYFFRVNYPEEAVDTVYMAVGKIAHKAIEKQWRDRDEALKLTKKLIEEYNLDTVYGNKCLDFVDNYFIYFSNLTSEDDTIEEYFKIKWEDGVFITGLFDRVTPNGTVLDWKTSAKTPKNVNNDVQFMLYHWAYEQLRGKRPSSVLFASLRNGGIVPFKYHGMYMDALLYEVIPSMIQSIRRGEFARTGMMNSWTCQRCIYRDFCWSQYYELDSGDTAY